MSLSIIDSKELIDILFPDKLGVTSEKFNHILICNYLYNIHYLMRITFFIDTHTYVINKA